MNKKLPALSAALLLALCSVGCSDSSDSSSESAAPTTLCSGKPIASEDTSGESNGSTGEGTSSGRDMYQSKKLFEQDFGSAENLDSGALLTISSTKVKPGGIAEVTLSVSNAEKQWSMCGLHIAYPDILECIIEDEATNEPEYTTGPAIKSAQADVARVWKNNLNEDLAEYHLQSIFFTALCPDDKGRDGDIATFKFRVPAAAQPGTVYNIDYYYSSNSKTKDMFSNQSGDPAYDKFAFSHATGGTITVE